MIDTVLQEADELIYKVAASCETTCNVVKYISGESIDHKNEFTSLQLEKQLKLEGLEKGKDYVIEQYKEYNSQSDLIMNINSMIQKLWGLGDREDAIKFGIDKICNIEFWLSPSDRQSNFRYSVVTIPGKNGLGYKAGRGEKPKYLPLVREYICDIYGAKEIQGYEADDAIAMRQTNNTILSSIDKDLNMIPGLHYNNYYDQVYLVPKGLGGEIQIGNNRKTYGLLAFYQQLLSGDDIDNIPGCLNIDKLHHKNQPKYSPEYAMKVLQQNGDTEQQYLEYIIEIYRNQYKERWLESLKEIADLIWIVRADKMKGSEYINSKIEEYGICQD